MPPAHERGGISGGGGAALHISGACSCQHHRSDSAASTVLPEVVECFQGSLARTGSAPVSYPLRKVFQHSKLLGGHQGL